ncbi:MAG: SAM-dependent methyltransferase [Chthoniobacteraceae bacterium]
MSLTDLIRAEIAQRGPIPFRDFMERALYHPDHGYYSSGRASIGRGGDFFTSVSVGALFGRLLARQFAEIWERLERPRPFAIVEQGAHRGEFAHDVLSGLREFAGECFAVVEHHLIEPSAALAAAQRERLTEFAPQTFWHRNLDALPPIVGVHFSNELLDAFPVHLVKRSGSEWVERFIEWRDGEFAFIDDAITSPELRPLLATLPPLPDGYQTEINLAALGWLDALGAKLERGFVLAIDYGFSRDEYYRPERTEGTLSAYAAHHRERDPLARPGEIDLTAHVEFTSLAEHAIQGGFDLAGFTDQHHLIVGLSRLHFTDGAPTTTAAQKELRALQTLMHPTLMGRSFKALCLGKGTGGVGSLAGFQFGGDARVALGVQV